jgi:hypothetical protein
MPVSLLIVVKGGWVARAGAQVSPSQANTLSALEWLFEQQPSKPGQKGREVGQFA